MLALPGRNVGEVGDGIREAPRRWQEQRRETPPERAPGGMNALRLRLSGPRRRESAVVCRAGRAHRGRAAAAEACEEDTSSRLRHSVISSLERERLARILDASDVVPEAVEVVTDQLRDAPLVVRGEM